LYTGKLTKQSRPGNIYGHTEILNLVHLFKQFTNTIVLVHFGSWFYKDIQQARKNIAQLAKENNIEIIVGYDSLEITI